jgi:hypothetical protein
MPSISIRFSFERYSDRCSSWFLFLLSSCQTKTDTLYAQYAEDADADYSFLLIAWNKTLTGSAVQVSSDWTSILDDPASCPFIGKLKFPESGSAGQRFLSGVNQNGIDQCLKLTTDYKKAENDSAVPDHEEDLALERCRSCPNTRARTA